MTTNANLFSADDWMELAKAGIDEFKLSVHGVTKRNRLSKSFFKNIFHPKKSNEDESRRLNYKLN